MKRTLSAAGFAALFLTWTPVPAHAAALCIAKKLSGPLRLRAGGACLSKEITIGSFDGTTLQFSGINFQIPGVSGTANSVAKFTAATTLGNSAISEVNGYVGIGTGTPSNRFHLANGNDVYPGITVEGEATTFNGIGVTLLNTAGGNTNPWVLGTGGALGPGGFSIGDSIAYRLVIAPSGNVGIATFNPTAQLDVAGMTKTHVLQIVGGADLSEKFQVAHSQSRIEPGIVVAIDPQSPGKLAISARPYNRRVAGVISGAGGVQAGMLMGQSGTHADGDHPVALSGRVYVWADASNGAIMPGDLLTTSNRPGHAMKVTDYDKARGAILGKAMSGLTRGRGLLLALVTLQ